MKNLKSKFIEMLNNSFCDYAELVFINEEEKAKYIEKAWERSNDEIEECIIGEIGEWTTAEEFEINLTKTYLERKQIDDFVSVDDCYEYIMAFAIRENQELIFDM